MTTGQEYAAHPQIDAPTFYGMRLAMFDALKYFHAHPKLPINRQTVAQQLREAAYRNEYLQAAGTQEVIARYFQHIVNTASDRELQNFIHDPHFSDKNLKEIDKALQDNHKLASALREDIGKHGNKDLWNGMGSALLNGGLTLWKFNDFNDAAKSCFRMHTMTESLRDFYKNYNVELQGITVTPTGMTPDQVTRLQDMDYVFRWFDAKDKPVQQYIEPLDPARYLSRPTHSVGLINLQLELEQSGLATTGKADFVRAKPDGLVNGQDNALTEASIRYASAVLNVSVDPQRLEVLLADPANRQKVLDAVHAGTQYQTSAGMVEPPSLPSAPQPDAPQKHHQHHHHARRH